MRKGLLCLLLLCCALTLTACHSISEGDYVALTAERDALLAENQVLHEELEELQQDYDEVCAERDALQEELEELQQLPSLSADYGDEDLLAQEDSYDLCVLDDSEYQVMVALTANRPVTDVALVSLDLGDLEGTGEAVVGDDPLYTQAQLQPGRPLVVAMAFPGDMPQVGVSFREADGTSRCYGITMSGKDGSILLVEI